MMLGTLHGILATWEAEIKQIVHKTPSSK
jgi:hypothetical protein